MKGRQRRISEMLGPLLEALWVGCALVEFLLFASCSVEPWELKSETSPCPCRWTARPGCSRLVTSRSSTRTGRRCWFAIGWATSPLRFLGADKTRTYCVGNIADVIMSLKCWLVLSRAQHLWRTQKKPFWKSSETFLVFARRATMLPCFATDGQHRRTQCCRHNVSFCWDLTLCTLLRNREKNQTLTQQRGKTTIMGPVPRSPISLIVDQVETFLPVCFLIWDGFSTKTPALQSWNQTSGRLVFLCLNSCSLLGHKSRWRISLKSRISLIGLWGTQPWLKTEGLPQIHEMFSMLYRLAEVLSIQTTFYGEGRCFWPRLAKGAVFLLEKRMMVKAWHF